MRIVPTPAHVGTRVGPDHEASRRGSVVVGLVLSVACVSCAPTPRPVDRRPPTAARTASGSVEAASAATRPPPSVPSPPTPAPPVFAATPALPEAALARLDAPSRAALAGFGRPVLLLDPALPIERGRITAGGAFLAQSVPDGPRTYVLEAHSTAVELPPEAPLPARPHRVRGRPATVTTNEGIVSVAFEEDGLAYVLEVECAAPDEDPTCLDDAALRALAGRLVRAGGPP